MKKDEQIIEHHKTKWYKKTKKRLERNYDKVSERAIQLCMCQSVLREASHANDILLPGTLNISKETRAFLIICRILAEELRNGK